MPLPHNFTADRDFSKWIWDSVVGQIDALCIHEANQAFLVQKNLTAGFQGPAEDNDTIGTPNPDQLIFDKTQASIGKTSVYRSVLSGQNVPHLYRAVAAAGDDALAVRRERGARDVAVMALECLGRGLSIKPP